jgi:hypothetical protein
LVQQITYLQNQLKKQSCTYNKCWEALYFLYKNYNNLLIIWQEQS